MSPQPRIFVVSAVNFTEGGPLSVLRDCLAAFERQARPDWLLYALVSSRTLFPDSYQHVRFLEFPQARRFYLKRLWLEFFHFHRLAQELQAEVWLSLHDISPRVPCRQFVYCHNPAPFHRFSWREARFDPVFGAFTLFYGLLYRLNIRSNDAVIVQQAWMAREMRRRYAPKQVWVARPTSADTTSAPAAHSHALPASAKVRFFYPAFPRVFKNHEVILRALRHLTPDTAARVEILFTLTGDENQYSRSISRTAKDLPMVRLLGRQTREAVHGWYTACDALLFPSRLETWGLPLSEFAAYGKPVLAAACPYAREATAGQEYVHFFPPEDDKALARLLEAVVHRRLPPVPRAPAQTSEPALPDWGALLNRLLG